MKYEPLFELERTGVQMEYCTNSPIVYPVHWHSAIELIYILNEMWVHSPPLGAPASFKGIEKHDTM